MAVAKSKAELDKDVEDANRAKNPADAHSDNPNRAKTTTQSVSQSADKVSKEMGADDSQPRRGDGTFPPNGGTPSGIPNYDMNGNRIK